MPINHEMALQKVSSQKLTAPEDESSWQTVIESKLPDAHDGWISKAADGFSLLAGLLLAVA